MDMGRFWQLLIRSCQLWGPFPIIPSWSQAQKRYVCRLAKSRHHLRSILDDVRRDHQVDWLWSLYVESW